MVRILEEVKMLKLLLGMLTGVLSLIGSDTYCDCINE